MSTQQKILSVLDQALGLTGRAQNFSASTPLLGALPGEAFWFGA